jgi:hypothetical protein
MVIRNPYENPTKFAVQRDTPMVSPSDQIEYSRLEIFEASDKELLNEAYRRGLITRFRSDTYHMYEHRMFDAATRNEMEADAMRRIMQDMIEKSFQSPKRFVKANRVKVMMDERVDMDGEIYICSHPDFVREERRR